ncbi:hypothetical protein IIA15_11845, partial [candidate division TA06 bacterium]|nr:hypothetical protein [candidate division TA06 bacterium]
TSRSEGAYWRYEETIRRWVSDLGTLVMGCGCIFVVRRELFQELRVDEGEDFALPLRAARLGYRTKYVRDAVVYERVAETPDGLFRTKVRIISKDFKTLLRYYDLLNPFRHRGVAMGLWCHKLLRWTTPFLLSLLLIAGGILAMGSTFWFLATLLQVLFCVFALLIRGSHSSNSGWWAFPYHFFVIQSAAALGMIRSCSYSPRGEG